MEYAVSLYPPPKDYNSNSYVGWDSKVPSVGYQALFAPKTIKYIKTQCQNYLMPILNMPVEIPDHEITGMITSVANIELGGNVPDIYTKDTFNVAENSVPHYDFDRIVKITTEAIIRNIRTPWEMNKVNNESFTIWSGVGLGTGNVAGLMPHPKIKLREKRPSPMLFNMNY